MKKFILAVFIGMILAINLYGIINELLTEEVEEIDHISQTTQMVYVE